MTTTKPMAQTLILSDLHLGNGGIFDTFAGAEALPAFLATFSGQPIRVLLNGDTVDFLLNEDPLELDIERAVRQAKDSVGSPATQAVFRALGKVLADGGEVIVRLGNHDAELALAEVQAILREALGQPPEIAARLIFERGSAPHVLELGGVRILISHGEQSDPWNRLDYSSLPGPGGPSGVGANEFNYPPGSRLVKTIMNPLKRQYSMRFADLLKPDFQGAVLTALAVNPTAVQTVFKGSTLTLLWQLFKRKSGPATFGPEGAEQDLGIAGAIERAGLTEEEQQALLQVMDPDSGELLSFGEEDSALGSAREKLGREGLKLYARAHRSLSGTEGDSYFALIPSSDEWGEAQRLSQKYKVDAVIFGHTHAARFKATPELTYINTGTWIWLMQLPRSDAGEEAWTQFLATCRKNPALDPKKGETVPLMSRFHAAILKESTGGGAHLALVRWDPEKGLITDGEQHITKAAGASV